MAHSENPYERTIMDPRDINTLTPAEYAVVKADLNRKILIHVMKFVAIKVALAVGVHMLGKYLNRRYS